MKKIMKKRKGFTLIEIIGVIIILGLILAITVPNISGVINNSYMKAYEVDLYSIKKAALDYILSENINTTPGVQTRIELSDMINVGLISEILDPQTKEVCDGYATVSENSGNYTVNSYLKCGSNYQSDNYNKTDFVLPVITLLGDNPLNLNVGDTYKEPGVKASDDVDGDITDRIVITGNIDPNVAGPHTIIYNVKDNAGNEAVSVTRTINVVDNLAPVITIETNGNSSYAKTVSTNVKVRDNAVLNTSSLKYLWNTSTATPVESSFVTTFTNNSNLTNPSSAAGEYYLWIIAKDSVGNTSIVRSNKFYIDNAKPIITLNGSASITIDKGSTYSDAGATATDVHSGLNGSVTSTGSVNPNVVGVYNITYNVSDRVGNIATPVTRTITVKDVLAPVITLNGSNPANMDAGTTYTDAGVSAIDDVDGDVTSKVTVTSNLNPSVGGTYTITYRVVDNAGNVATATRTVNVYVTWYQTRTISSATYYDNYSASSSTYYSCPSGYTSSGSGSSMTCYTTSTSYTSNIASTTYSCPSGYTASGSGSSTRCYKTTDATSTAATSSKTCSSGTYVSSVDQCRIYTDSRVYSCSSGTLSGTQCKTSQLATPTCSSGTWVSGSGCKRYHMYTSATACDTNCSDPCAGSGGDDWGCPYYASASCPSGYSMNSSTTWCYKYVYVAATESCPSGWTMSGAGNCYQVAATPTTTYSCSSGKLSGTKCYTCSSGTITGISCVTEASNIATTTYSCPSGYTSSGSGSSMTCYTTNTSYTSNNVTTTYSCPYGGTLSGTTCYRGYYQCSSGTLSGSSCYGTWSSWSTTPATPSSTLGVNTEKRLSSV
jgi:prepilin-type N-terminal cleavage/methylation domain-containing protein